MKTYTDTDPVAEVRRARERIAEKFGFDLDAIVKDAMSRQAADARRVPPKETLKRKPRRSAGLGA